MQINAENIWYLRVSVLDTLKIPLLPIVSKSIKMQAAKIKRWLSKNNNHRSEYCPIS